MKRRKPVSVESGPVYIRPPVNLAETALRAIEAGQSAREALIARIGSPRAGNATGRPSDGLGGNENGPE